MEVVASWMGVALTMTTGLLRPAIHLEAMEVEVEEVEVEEVEVEEEEEEEVVDMAALSLSKLWDCSFGLQAHLSSFLNLFVYFFPHSDR